MLLNAMSAECPDTHSFLQWTRLTRGRETLLWKNGRLGGELGDRTYRDGL